MPSLPRPKPTQMRRVGGEIPPLLSVQSLYVVELMVSLSTRLASCTHARRVLSTVEMPTASLTLAYIDR
jgi:hypothetical protein